MDSPRRPRIGAALLTVVAVAALGAPAVASADRATPASVRDCVERLGLTFGEEGEAPPGGDPRMGLDVPDARYAGFVVWPSDHVADVYVARSVRAARRVAERYERFLQQLGEGELRVTRFANVVIGDDDEQPTRAEVRRLRRCA